MDKSIPVSPAQSQMIKATLQHEGLPFFNIGGYYIIEGDIDKTKLFDAIKEVATFSEVFNLSFFKHKENWFQKVVSKEITIDFIDLSMKSNPYKVALELMDSQMKSYINFKKDNLYIFSLIKLSDNKHIWFNKFHHLIIDGWGIYQLLHKVWRKYQNKELIYKQFTSIDAIRNEYIIDDFDHKNINGLLKKSNDYSFYAKELKIQINTQNVNNLKDYCKGNSISLFHYFLAIYATYWFKRTGEPVILGIHLLNRGKKNWEYRSVVGPFVNTLPLVISPELNMTITDLANDIKFKLEELYLKQDTLVDTSWVNKCVGVLSFENFNYKTSINELNITPFVLETSHALYPITLNFRNYSNSQTYTLEMFYQTAILDELEAKSLLTGIEFLLDTSLSKIKINDLALMKSKDVAKIKEFSIGESLDLGINLMPKFHKNSMMQPSSKAITYLDKTYTYKELQVLIAKVSSSLADFNNGQIICVLMDKSPELIITILAIWNIGKVSLIIDPSQPRKRIASILEDSNPSKIITLENESISGISHSYYRDLIKDQHRQYAECISNGAEYILYTSGSTGIPKGTRINNKSLKSTFYAWCKYYDLLDNPPNVLQIAPIGSDVFIGDILKTLFTGGHLVLLSDTQKLDLVFIRNVIEMEEITLIDTTPSMHSEIINNTNYNQLTSLQLLILGAEECSKNSWKEINNYYKNKARVINGYGLTETTIENLVYENNDNNLSLTRVPIGRPLPNNIIWVMSDAHELLPLGEFGEIYISGDVAQNIPLNINDSRFIQDPFNESFRMYKTGDFGRWLPEGIIEFNGRKDRQVQVRGYRIELGEIESVLQDCFSTSYVACDWDLSTKQIVAYVKSDESIKFEESFLKEILGQYKPHKVYFVEDWPLGVTGKVAINKLKKITSKSQLFINEKLSKMEEKIHDLLLMNLNINKCSIYDNYFNLGGDSLSAAQFVDTLNNEVGEIRYGEFYQLKTIKEIAIFYESKQKTNYTLPEELISYLNASFDWKLELKKDSKNRCYRFLILLSSISNEETLEIIRILKNNNDFSLQYIQTQTGEIYKDTQLIYQGIQAFLDDLFADVKEQESMYFNNVYFSFNREYPASVSHKIANFVFPKAYAVNSIYLEGHDLENEFSEEIYKFLLSQPLLRSVLFHKQNKFFLKEYLLNDRLSVPFVDLSALSPEVIDEIIEVQLESYIKSTDNVDYMHRFYLVKRTLVDYQFIYAIDDHIHDVMTDSIFDKRFSRLKYNEAFYECDYAKAINKDIMLSDSDIVLSFQLSKFINLQYDMQEQILNIKQASSIKFYKHYFYDLNGLSQDDTFSLFAHLFVKFWQFILKTEFFAYWCISNTRINNDDRFSELIADFTDMVPMINSENNSLEIAKKLKYAAENNLSFINLILNQDLKEKYPNSKELLKFIEDIPSWRNFIAFNYQQETDKSFQIKIVDNKNYSKSFYKNRCSIFYGAPVWEGIYLQLQHSFDIEESILTDFFEKEIRLWLNR